MKLKYRYMIPLYIAAFLLQTAVLPQLALPVCTPNLLLCLLIMTSFWEEGYMGAVLGIASGIVQDMCFGHMIGIAALCYYAVALGVMAVRHFLFRSSLLSSLLVVLLSTAAYSFLYWGISVIMGSSYRLFYMAETLPFLLLYNGAVSMVLYFIFRSRARRYPEDWYL